MWHSARWNSLVLAIGVGVVVSSSAHALQVTSVHDGDTFRLGAERVRVLGMDAPEINGGARCPAEQAAAERAREYLRKALQQPGVEIERHGHDVYGRTLARITINGRDIAPDMIDRGLAKPYVPRKHGDWCR